MTTPNDFLSLIFSRIGAYRRYTNVTITNTFAITKRRTAVNWTYRRRQAEESRRHRDTVHAPLPSFVFVSCRGDTTNVSCRCRRCTFCQFARGQATADVQRNGEPRDRISRITTNQRLRHGDYYDVTNDI